MPLFLLVTWWAVCFGMVSIMFGYREPTPYDFHERLSNAP